MRNYLCVKNVKTIDGTFVAYVERIEDVKRITFSSVYVFFHKKDGSAIAYYVDNILILKEEHAQKDIVRDGKWLLENTEIE